MYLGSIRKHTLLYVGLIIIIMIMICVRYRSAVHYSYYTVLYANRWLLLLRIVVAAIYVSIGCC